MTHPLLDTPIGPLRQRLIDDMKKRRLSAEKQRNYLRDIGPGDIPRTLARHCGRQRVTPYPDRAAGGRRSCAGDEHYRAGEAPMLKVVDIDSKRMLLRVAPGKGGRYRDAMLLQILLTLLRQWWRAGRQQGVMHREG